MRFLTSFVVGDDNLVSCAAFTKLNWMDYRRLRRRLFAQVLGKCEIDRQESKANF